MKPTLCILAAGMGSRFGGVKQIEPVGSNGEIILEYSVFDAIRAGFGKVVFVIRRDIQEDFEKHVIPRIAGKIEYEMVFQDYDDLPQPFKVPEGRKKPWGTGHAVRAARNVIKEPFAVINADDFYGKDAFIVMGKFLAAQEAASRKFSMIGYRLENTVSDNGSVSRGVCRVADNGDLIQITEHTKIERSGNEIVSRLSEVQADGKDEILDPQTIVSMNLFGFTPDVFPMMEKMFTEFLQARGQEATSEFYIPSVATHAVQSGYASLEVLPSSSRWFGITYREDRDSVVASIAGLSGVDYPEPLWAE